MYVPDHFRLDEQAALELIDACPFALLVTSDRQSGMEDAVGPFLSHLPMVREDDYLLGHLASGNPHAGHISGESTVVFSGVDGYISPRWYRSAPNVPTWNYQAVHVTGQTEVVDDAPRAMAAVDKLVEIAEQGAWTVDWSNGYYARLLDHITVFRMRMKTIVGKRKMSQNRQANDRAGVVSGLIDSGQPRQRTIADIMRNLEQT